MIQYEYEPEELKTIDQPPDYLKPYGVLLLSSEKDSVDVSISRPDKSSGNQNTNKKGCY
jgi:hypothetical protein